MRLIWKIAKWEFTKTFTNKQFLIGLILTPLIMVAFAGLPQLMEKLDKPKQEIYYVIDELGAIDKLEQAASETHIKFAPFKGNKNDIEDVVTEEAATGYFVLNNSFKQTGKLEIHSTEKRLTFTSLKTILSSLLQEIRVNEVGIQREQVAYLTAPANLVPVQINGNGHSLRPEQIGVSGALAGILLFLIFTSGTMLLQSALQEKQDRMVEIILSSVTSENLMQGKVIGNFFLGVFQLVFWLIIGLPVAWYFLNIPVFEMISVSQLPILVFFALMGYLLFAALFVGIGATMTDLQSASNTQSMVFMLPLLAVLFIGPVISNPNGVVARIGTLFPLTSPSVTILRVGLADVPIWEVVVAGFILLITTYMVLKGAAKLFRVGMLMYGKPASLSEMWKWLRY